MAKVPEKPGTKTILTGAAQPVTDSVERARGYLKDRPEPSRPPSTRKNFRKHMPERENEGQDSVEPRAREPGGEDDKEDRD